MTVRARDRVEVKMGFATSAVMLEREALQTLAESFEGRRLPIARSIYLALVELAMADRVEATRQTIADYAGVTKKALDDYVPAMEEAGLVVRERRADDDGRSLPNVWTVLKGGRGTAGSPGGSAEGEGHPADPAHPSSTSPRAGRRTDGAGREGAPSVSFHEVVPEAMRADALELLAQRRRVDRRLVSVEEMEKAAAALAAFNAASESDYGLGAHLTSIVMRVRDRPAFTVDAHVRLVQSAWRIQWWRRSQRPGRVTPAVIYGSTACFENVVQDAVDEKNGRTPESCRPDGARRFERSTPISEDL